MSYNIVFNSWKFFQSPVVCFVIILPVIIPSNICLRGYKLLSTVFMSIFSFVQRTQLNLSLFTNEKPKAAQTPVFVEGTDAKR